MTSKVTYYVGLSGLTGAREAALARDGYRCRYCGVSLRLRSSRSVDHVIPVSMGGRSTLANLVASCHPCNSAKDSMSLKEAGMKMLPRPQFDPDAVRNWMLQARRKCCVHCGLSGRAHVRDLSYPHGEMVRCRETGERFLPRDCPPHVYEKLNIDPAVALTLPYVGSKVSA